VKIRLDTLLTGRTRNLIAALAVLVLVAAVFVGTRPAGNQGPAVRTEDATIAVPGGPGVTGTVALDTTLYLPSVAGPAPAVIMAHGFGGSKQSIAADARDLAGHGFVVLAYTARGFGRSTGQIALDSLDYEIPDARALVTWLSKRPEVIQDSPGDPRVGVTGASYGGALSLMLAGTDPRVDAVAPLITWNDLSTALFPNAIDPTPPTAGTPAQATASSNGVFKKSWAANLMSSVISGASLTGGSAGTASSDSGDSGFGRGSGTANSTTAAPPADGASAESPGRSSTPPARSNVGSAGCGRMMLNLCAAYAQAAETGREPADLVALLARSSPRAVVGNITAPTLLVQGERDTLFGLDQSDANARAIAAKGTPVAVTWYSGGHDGGSPDRVTRDRISNWFTYYLAKSGAAPAPTFNYSVEGPLSDTGRARTRTLQVRAYPGLSGAVPVLRTTLALSGSKQTVLNPPGGSPAAISSLPGLSGLAGNALANLSGGIPGQVARFSSSPLQSLMVIAGTPRVSVAVSAVPLAGAATSTDGAVLFAAVSKVTAGGTRVLAGSAVAPIRITGLPTNGTAKTVQVDLPAVAFQVEAGSRIEVTLSTTDQGFAGPTAPAVYQISLAPPSNARAAGASGALSVPLVGGVRVSAGEVPTTTLIALIVLAVLAITGLVLMGRVGRPRRRAASVSPFSAATVDRESIDGIPTQPGSPLPQQLPVGARPLEIVGLGKSYPGGVAAVTDVSFRVETGQVLGLLGPNGAGKTTTLRMVMGLIKPTAGEIKVFGQLVRPGADILARVGSFVEGSGFLPHLSGKANLNLYWRATGRPAADAHMAEALEIAGLGQAINRRVKTYSQGMRQRLAIAQAMLGLPDLLLLDEPTNGLDPPQIHAMREVLRGYAASGRTVLVSSHMLSEVEQTCSHVVVVHHGRTIAAGTVAEMVAASGDMVFSVDSQATAIRVLRALPGIGDVEVDSDNGVDGSDLLAATADGARDRAGVVRADLQKSTAAGAVAALVNAGVAVTTAAPRNRLEDVFLELVGAAGPSSQGGGSR